MIKVKNYLCSSLVNYRLLNKTDFSIGSTSDTIKMLNEIKTYMSLPNFILNNNTIPSIWYINSILDYLNKIPEDYKKNDYSKLFKELIKELRESINSLNFEKLILFRNKLKFIDKMNDYYENVKELMNNITINEKIKEIVENIFIPVDISFSYDEKEKKFELTKSQIKLKLFEDKIIYEEPKKKLTTFKTIEAFTRHFPNLNKYQIIQDISPIKIIKELSINKKINDYLDIIKDTIIEKEILENKEYDNIYKERIQDYIMNKIYEKIYPPEPNPMDLKIYKKSIQLSWVEPNYFVKEDYIYDSLLPDILNEFKLINISKTPYQKLKCIKKIKEYIISLIQFNEGIDKKIGADDIFPVLNYIFIQAHPLNIFTDLEFIKIFLVNNKNKEYNILNIKSIYKLILNYSPENFNLTKEEFDKRSIKSAQ